MKTKFIFLAALCALAAALGLLNRTATAAPSAQFTLFPTPTPGPDGRIIYIVQEGDSAWRIAALFGFKSTDDLYKLNGWEKDHVLLPGDQIYLGLAGPAITSPTPGPSPTPAPVLPTATLTPGWGILCVVLYDDLNGDSIRQEEEPALGDSQISVSNRSGAVSLTANSDSATDSDCTIDPENGSLIATGFVIFENLPEGDYNVSVAAPKGYNPTTIMTRSIHLGAGDKTYLTFGMQANTETKAEIVQVVTPETPGKSPTLGIVGGVILLIGIGLGVYAFFLRRAR